MGLVLGIWTILCCRSLLAFCFLCWVHEAVSAHAVVCYKWNTWWYWSFLWLNAIFRPCSSLFQNRLIAAVQNHLPLSASVQFCEYYTWHPGSFQAFELEAHWKLLVIGGFRVKHERRHAGVANEFSYKVCNYRRLCCVCDELLMNKFPQGSIDKKKIKKNCFFKVDY